MLRLAARLKTGCKPAVPYFLASQINIDGFLSRRLLTRLHIIRLRHFPPLAVTASRTDGERAEEAHCVVLESPLHSS